MKKKKFWNPQDSTQAVLSGTSLALLCSVTHSCHAQLQQEGEMPWGHRDPNLLPCSFGFLPGLPHVQEGGSAGWVLPQLWLPEEFSLGEVSDGPSFLVPRLKPFFQWGKYSVLVHFETGILWVNLNSSQWVQKLEYKCTPDLEIHLVKCFHPGRPGNTQDVSHNSVLHFFRFQCPPAARCDSAGLLGVFLSSCRLNSNLTLNSANLINIQKPHMFVFPPCSLCVTGTECYSKANLTARTAYNVRRFGKHSWKRRPPWSTTVITRQGIFMFLKAEKAKQKVIKPFVLKEVIKHLSGYPHKTSLHEVH